MAHPFQSIVDAPESPLSYQAHRDEPKSFDQALEVLPEKELAATSISPEQPPFGPSELSAPIETGLTDLSKPTNVSGARALPHERKPLRGDIYTPADVLELLNSHFFVGRNNQETGIFRINHGGSVMFVPPDQFKLEIQNIFVRLNVGGSTRPVPAEKFWKESPQRHEKVIVFKPGGTTDQTEHNLWSGYGVEPSKGWQRQRPLLRHIREVICRRDKEKFKYLIRFLAWAVQHPDKHSGVIIVLKSRKQGTGKSTLGKVMLDIFGQHGALIDDKERFAGSLHRLARKRVFRARGGNPVGRRPQGRRQAKIAIHG